MSKAGLYYYEQLNKEQKQVYHLMKQGLLALEDEFPIPRLTPRELADIYFMIRMDDPSIFYTTEFRYSYYPGSDNIILIPEYMFTKDKIREHINALNSRVKKLAGKAPSGDETAKLLYIHDVLCEGVYYDKLKKSYSHEIIGSLGNGTAVCEGIAKGVKALCDALGIWCIVVLSEAAPERGIKYRHAWNLVRIDKKYYHIDATFDNTLGRGEDIRYDYMKLSDKQIYRDHEPSIWRLPESTDGDSFYYRAKKLSWTTADEVRNRTAQAVKKGRVLTFHWRGGYLGRKIIAELFEIFREEASKKNRKALCSVNWAQGVVRVRFPEEASDCAIAMEQANEGEELEARGPEED